MAGSAGSIAQFFPDIFGGGAAMSGAGSAATTTAATGAGSMALGPWMAASAGIQALAGLGGGLMGQQSQREAMEEAAKNLSRNWGFDTWQREKERGAQAQSLLEGYNFMQSPVFRTKATQDFADAYSLGPLAGKFDPYLLGMATRMR
jgi:hypothetical protein